MSHPLRLLVSGYGLAALAGTALVALGGPFWAGGFAFWFGGAALTVALATAPGTRRWFRAAPRPPGAADEEAAMLARALRRWEEDRLSDAPGAVRSAGSERPTGS